VFGFMKSICFYWVCGLRFCGCLIFRMANVRLPRIGNVCWCYIMHCRLLLWQLIAFWHRGVQDVAIYKLRVWSSAARKLVSGYSVSDTPYEIGCSYQYTLSEFGGGWFRVMDVLDIIPQRKESL